MTKGSFVRNSDQKIVYTGERSDRPSLESGHTFIAGLKRPIPSDDNVYDDYKYVEGQIVTVKDALKPTDDEQADRALDQSDIFKKITFNALYELAKQMDPELTKKAYKQRLKKFA